MRRAAGIAFLAAFATPAVAAGNPFDGISWWDVVALYSIVLVPFWILAVGIGFFLRQIASLSTALISAVVVSFGLLAWAVAAYGFEKAADALFLLAFFLMLFGPFLGLGWFMEIRDQNRRLTRIVTLNTGSNHG